ncbi:MAG: anti-phage ZorAB system protein ZorA [Methylovulum sp.]|nr:anti-phage ZorAB system protein ZorA [Methylovulum sp.]
MDFITTENLTAYWHLIVLGSIIIVLLGLFIFGFLIPSIILGKNLNRAIQNLKITKGNGAAINIDLIGSEMMTTPKLGHCWTEFAQTLHKQTASDDMGQERVLHWRSTVPAEVFFNVETLIAVELRTEYFKHQPGILTGIGIIGTFAGLLRGLSTFSVSSDPETVRLSLDTLIQGVREAFYVSLFAIALAMLTTFAEKLIVTRRIKQVEELCQLLDSLFEGGAGEEYLARLVKAGESRATQTAQLKDVLVSDLKEMLAEMTRQQTEAIAASFATSSENSGNRIAQAISDSLSEPLQKIAAAVNTTTDNNGEAVTRVLNEVLITFSQKLEDMFGGQMGGINQLLQQTTTAMQSTVARFDQLANNLGDAGKNAADVMSERLSAALESMEARQLALNNTMTEFVTQLREMVQSSQSETSSQLQKTLALLGDQVATMTDQLQKQAKIAADTHQNQQGTLQQNALALNQELATQVQTSMSAMQSCVTILLDATKDNTQRMESSAGTLSLAAENFAKAGNSVAGVIQQTGTVTDKMATTSIALNTVANTVQAALNDYNTAGKVMAQMVEALKATVEAAKKDATVSQALVNQIKQSAEHLLQAQSSVDGIFAEVCKALAEAHEEFTKNVKSGLVSSNVAYQKELRDSVDILKSAIQELGDLVDNISVRR